MSLELGDELGRHGGNSLEVIARRCRAAFFLCPVQGIVREVLQCVDEYRVSVTVREIEDYDVGLGPPGLSSRGSCGRRR